MKTPKKPTSPIADYSVRLAAEHASYRTAILALRPDWDPAALEQVKHLYGPLSDPGLHDIRETLRRAQDLTERFAKR